MHMIYLFLGYSLQELFDLEAPDNEDESIEVTYAPYKQRKKCN